MTYKKWRLPHIIWLGGNCLLFAAFAVVRQITDLFVGNIFTGASITAALAAAVFAWMLFRPQLKWLRILVVGLPPLTMGLRLIALVLDHPVYWLGVLLSLGYGATLAFVGPIMVPPPITNGTAKELLGGDRG